MSIKNYKFGWMDIDGEEYTKDLIITPTGIQTDWRRQRGHALLPDDLQSVLDEVQPKRLVVGAGKFGLVKITLAMRREAKKRDIDLVAAKTEKAAEIFNASDAEHTVGAFHLNC